MSGAPAVIVKKGGFLSALFHGVFTFLTVTVVCATGLGVYALHIADSKVDGLFTITRDMVSEMPQWRENLPPLLGEVLNDRRAPDYRDQVAISVRPVKSADRWDGEVALVEVCNTGSETISMLALNIVLEDERGVPVREKRAYVATPIACDESEWRGLLFPDSTRSFVVRCFGEAHDLRPTAEIVDLRVWNGPDNEGVRVDEGA
jgi:hypothetical protein